MEIGRNQPCYCGSGEKYKRCCLGDDEQVRRGVREVEALLGELTRLAWEAYREDCEDAFGRFYEGGLAAFGCAGPTARELEKAEAWLLFDCELSSGATALESLGHRLSPGGGVELLAGSELRLWSIDALEPGGAARARCPVTGAEVGLETSRAGDPRVLAGGGSLLVAARTIWLAPGRAGLFAPTAVDPDVEDELVARAHLRWEGCGDHDVFWRRFGGELARLAVAWPEERCHTRDGQRVQDARAAYELRDEEGAARRLEGDPALEAVPPEELDEEGLRAWRWWAADDGLPFRSPPPVPGVRWLLDHEDRGERAQLARVELDPHEGRLWIFASTPERLSAAERRVKRCVGRKLRRRVVHEVEPPDATPRWQRERWEGFLDELVVGSPPFAPERLAATAA